MRFRWLTYHAVVSDRLFSFSTRRYLVDPTLVPKFTRRPFESGRVFGDSASFNVIPGIASDSATEVCLGSDATLFQFDAERAEGTIERSYGVRVGQAGIEVDARRAENAPARSCLCDLFAFSQVERFGLGGWRAGENGG